MTRFRSQNPNNIDGFVPNSNGRHAGFSPRNGQARVRRPGLHSDVPQSSPLMTGGPHRPQQRRSVNSTMPAGTSQPGRSSQMGPQLPPPTFGQNPLQPAPDGGRQRRNRDANLPPEGKRRRFNARKIAKRVLFMSLALLLIGGGWFGWKLYENNKRVFGDANILDFLNASKLKGEDKGQVNILLAGVSTDDPGHGGANLTDSIMLVSLDTNNKKAAMISIPRDLWVNIPQYGYSKINAANAYGDEDNFSQPGYPAGGMGLLSQVISQDLEMPIHYYAKVNYSALRDAVNAVGGVSVNIQSSDKRGLYDPNISKADKGPLKLPNGVQTLDGQTALNLARARGDPPGDGRYPYGFEKSDFTRTENQRMLLLGLKDKITSGSTVSNPVKLSQLLDVVGKNTKTDLQPSEVRRLYDLGKQIKTSDIQSLSFNDANGKNLLTGYRTADGASALIPAAGINDYSQIQQYIKKATSNDPTVRESARIIILNGGEITGLASKYSNVLKGKGFNVTAVGDASPQQGNTLIIDLSDNGKASTKASLQKAFSGSTVTTTNNTGYTEADFIVVLGTKQAAPAATDGTN